MLLIPKANFIRDQKHLIWIRDLPDLKTGGGPCEASHLRRYSGAGVGIKPSDSRVIPQSHEEHMKLHRGELTYFRGEVGIRHAIDLAEALYKISGDYPTALNMIREYRGMIWR